MDRYTFSFLPFMFFCCVILVVTGCSDSGTSADQDDPPSLPSQLTPAMIDLSYFWGQNVPNDENYMVYKTVETVAVAGGSLMQVGGLLNTADAFLLFMKSTNQRPEFSNGSWVWSVTIPFGLMKDAGFTQNVTHGEITISISAKPVTGGIEWEIRYTGMIGDDYLDDFGLIRGFTSSDEMSGEWNFYLPDGGNNPVMVYTWEKTSLTDFTMTMMAVYGGEVVTTVEYRKNGPENWMTFREGSEVVSVYWNETTHSGWIEQQGQRVCYENFQNSACS